MRDSKTMGKMKAPTAAPEYDKPTAPARLSLSKYSLMMTGRSPVTSPIPIPKIEKVFEKNSVQVTSFESQNSKIEKVFGKNSVQVTVSELRK